MAEYVTKEQVIDWYRPYGHRDEHIPFETLVSDLRDMKAVDVAPVRHGRWLNIEEYTVLSYNTYFPMTTTSETCSECNVRSAFLGKKSYVKDNRCPNCGAKMDLEAT